MKAWMIILYMAAVGFAIAGLYVMFYYDPEDLSTKIVGGDAYNYIIIGVRGVGLICVGIISALVAVGLSVYDARTPKDPTIDDVVDDAPVKVKLPYVPE